MADTVLTQSATPATVPASTRIATREVTYSGDASSHIAPVGLVTFAGADDAKTATDVTSSNPLPINDAGGSLTIDGNVGILGGSVGLLAPLPGVLGVSGGGVEASALRVTLANDSTGVVSVDDNGGSLTVDGSVAVSALPALAAGTANIGDVDVLSVPAPLNIVGGGVEAAALRVTLANDSTGVISVDDNGGSLTVDGSVSLAAAIPAGTNNIGDVDVLSVVPGTGATALGKAEDAVHASGDVGVMALAVRQDTLATLSSATGDYEPLHLDPSGRVYVNAQGPVAHDAAVSGNPLLVGSEARTTDITPVASGDAARAIADTLGKPVVLIGAVNDLQLRGTATYTTTTAADLIAAQGAGIRIVVMSVLVTNAHATVGTKVEIRDGTTVRILGFAAANGGGYSHNGGGVPLFISTANQAITGRCATTGADVDITVSGYRIAN